MENKIEFFQFTGEFLGIKQTEKDVWEVSYIMHDAKNKETVSYVDKTDIVTLNSNDEFILVEAESLSRDDEFLKYELNLTSMEITKKRIIESIKAGTKNFYRPKNDPSTIEETEMLSFESGKKPAIWKSYNWWAKAARRYAPERGSRLGTENEYYAFLGVLIKKLVENGMSIEDAWDIVCVNPQKFFGTYCVDDIEKLLEPTGSREICGFCDVVNTSKILALDYKHGGFKEAGGRYDYGFKINPLDFLDYYSAVDYRDGGNGHSVGWIVLER